MSAGQNRCCPGPATMSTPLPSQHAAEAPAYARPSLVKLQHELSWPGQSSLQAQSHQRTTLWDDLRLAVLTRPQGCFPGLSGALHLCCLPRDLLCAKPRKREPRTVPITLTSYSHSSFFFFSSFQVRSPETEPEMGILGRVIHWGSAVRRNP